MIINLDLFLIISCAVLISYGQDVSQPCLIQRTQSPGICQRINDCPAILSQVQKGKRRHTRCGFVGRIEIVCCPTTAPTTTTTPAPIINANSRISERKCDEYKAAVYEYVHSISLAADSEPNALPISKCGRVLVPLIVGGEFAKPREFPHMALIGFDKGDGSIFWGCGGSLISEQYVLTAGHCLYFRVYGEPKYVRVGDLNIDLDNDDARPENLNIIEIIPHPQYRRATKYNDIALLKLDHSINIDPYKRPACLPTTFDGPEEKVIATGWGHTAWSGNASNHLQKVILDKFTQQDCNDTYQYEINRKLQNGIVYDTQICAGSKNEEKDTCQGDSGGPIQVFHPYQYCMYTIVGITSFGITCGNIGVPGVYTRVYPYVDWIEKTVWGTS